MRDYNRKIIHERYHQNIKLQQSVINKNNFTYHIILRILDRYLQNSKNVLDIGCGVGTLSFYIANKRKKVMGIDISKNAIDACKKNAKLLGIKNKTEFRVMDFPTETPLEKFDLIIFIEVLEHLPDDIDALKKIFSMLNRKGITIVSTPSKSAPLFKMGLAKEFDKRVGHLRRYSFDDLERKCCSVGFRVLSKEKTEGVLRNFLFLNPLGGKFIRFLKYPFYLVFNIIDQLSLAFFGESQIFIVAQKP